MCWRRWYSWDWLGTYFGVLVPWVRIRRWRRPSRTQAACTGGALLACSIPDPPPRRPAHTTAIVGCWGEDALYLHSAFSQETSLLSKSICVEPTLKVVGGHKSQDHEYDAHAGARCVSCGRARFMNALRLMTGRMRRPLRLASGACALYSQWGIADGSSSWHFG